MHPTIVTQSAKKPVQACRVSGRRSGLWHHGGMAAGMGKRPTDMVLSLAAILVPELLISWFFTRTPDSPPIRAVDWAPTLSAARAQAPYPVLAPANLPATWIPRKVVWAKPGEPGLDGQPATGHTWQLGVLSPDEVYLTVTQRDSGQATLVSGLTRSGAKDGSATVGGSVWDRYVSGDGRTRALVRADVATATVVAGDTTYEGLAAFAATLTAGP